MGVPCAAGVPPAAGPRTPWAASQCGSPCGSRPASSWSQEARQVLSSRRAAAEAYLARHLTPRTLRYFARRRLTALGLPGGIPAGLSFLPRIPAVRRTVRRLGRLRRALS